MKLHQLALKSLWHRRLIMGLTLISVAVSVFLLVGVERIREGVRTSFSGTISQTDLIVGGAGGTLQLLLYAVFNIGQGIPGISYATFERIEAHGDVEWAVPFALGDSYRGFRVFGTTPEYFVHFRHHGDEKLSFAEGRTFATPFEVVLGSEVAARYAHLLDDEIILSHGVGTEGASLGLDHDNLRFRIVGILEPTATPVDQTVYVDLTAIEAMHIGWEDGAPPAPGEGLSQAELAAEELELETISGFFLRAQSRLRVLSLQREIMTDADEPLIAILPGVALAELWKNFSFFESSLLLISALVMLGGLVSMFVAMYATLQVRRREMSILRALGAGFPHISGLFVTEAVFICGAAAVLGVGCVYAALFLLKPLMLSQFGIYIAVTPPGATEGLALASLLVLGMLVGFIPAVKAYRTALSDGLSVRL